MEIVIRRAEPFDYEAAYRLFSGPKVIRGTMQMPFPSIDLWRRRYENPAEGVILLVACIEGEVVGQLGLHTYPDLPSRMHVAQILMAVRDDWQGRGIGTALLMNAIEYADRWLNVMRLELEVFSDNDAAVRLYRKFGFEIEGTMKQYAFRDGRYVDAHLMARLRT